jgi:DNA modification methylase
VEKNKLYHGDNLEVLRQHVKDESVDLIYLDPPFNSRQDYNVLFAEKDGTRSSSQIMAFEDTWEWNVDAERAYEEIVERGGRVSEAMRAFRTFLGHSDMMAYLAMMAPRLTELHRVLKVTGSIYLHCDPTAGHYLKMLMDAVFGPQYFRNEIVWKRTTAHSSAKRYAPIHDLVFYYGKTDVCTWNSPRTEYEDEYLDKYYRFDDGNGRLHWRADLCAAGVRHGRSGLPWRGIDPSKKGMHWKFTVDKLDELDKEGRIYWPPGGTMPQYKRYREELKGKAVPDIWDDIDRINPVGAERLGYPTQKPEALLERIVAASSDKGGLVLDPFCGCGTAISVAQKLSRRWIGIDITHLAVGLIKQRLADAFGDSVRDTYEVIGEPADLSGAQDLATNDPYQFQWWALGLVGARPTEEKKGADRGIDGRLYFHDENKRDRKTKQIIFSVKAGHVQSAYVRDLRGVIDREDAQIGVLICMEAPTKPMLKEAAEAGFYKPPGLEDRYPRIQILTIEELLAGKAVAYPRLLEVTFKKAPKAKAAAEEKGHLPFEQAETDEPF